MKLYNGDIKPVNGTDAALVIFKDFLQKTMDLMNYVDYSRFFEETATPLERLDLINKGVEFVMAFKERRDRFMGFTQRAKKAFDVCIGHDQITEHEVDLLHYFLCVRSVIFKMTIGDTPDATLMNKKIAELVDKAICSSYEGKDFTFEDSAKDDMQNLFSDEFLEKLKKIKFPNTKYFALVKLLKRAIKEFGKTNTLKAAEFSKRLKNIIDRYNSRNELSEVQEIIEETVDTLSEELEKVFKDLKKEKSSFEEMGISYIEKAFYDILVAVADEHNFRKALNEETYIELARKIREHVNGKAKYADWTNRQDIRDELYSDLAVLLKKNGYPPTVIDEAYDEVLKQVENFKKYEE
jgi:type I restriction enzyme R subunit